MRDSPTRPRFVVDRADVASFDVTRAEFNCKRVLAAVSAEHCVVHFSSLRARNIRASATGSWKVNTNFPFWYEVRTGLPLASFGFPDGVGRFRVTMRFLTGV